MMHKSELCYGNMKRYRGASKTKMDPHKHRHPGATETKMHPHKRQQVTKQKEMQVSRAYQSQAKKYSKQSPSGLLVEYIRLQVGCWCNRRKGAPGRFTRLPGNRTHPHETIAR